MRAAIAIRRDHPKTGVLAWFYATGDQVNSSPAVAKGIVYVGSADGKVYAFGLAGGTTGGVRRPAPASLRPNPHLPASPRLT